MRNSYTVKDLINLFLSHIVLIIVITLLGGAAAFAFSKFTLPLQYSSHITMYVQSYAGIIENNSNPYNNISNSKQLVNTYIEVLKDDAVMGAVSGMLFEQFDEEVLQDNFRVVKGKITPESIRKCITISSVEDTSAVKVVTLTKSPELSAAICYNLTAVAPDYVDKAVGVGSINTIDKAKVYRNPVAPNNTKNGIIGMAAAFLLVVMIILIVDYFDNTIKDANRISKKYNKAIIGEIQQFGDGKKKRGKKGRHSTELVGLLTDKDIPFNVIESYKTIRANILFTAADSDKKIIAVSSSNPGEGKSTSAANLAVVLAQTGSKVLLIDADMRKPVQHKIFKVRNNEGLSTLIIKKSSVTNSVKSNIINNLSLLTSGPIPPNPSELLASDNFKALMDKFSSQYDYIIIDTPPINVVSDAMLIKDLISGIMLIVRYASTTYDELSNCMKQIKLAQANVLGFVINDVYKNHSSYYYNYKYRYKYKKYGYGGYGYGYGYGYKADETSEEEDAD